MGCPFSQPCALYLHLGNTIFITSRKSPIYFNIPPKFLFKMRSSVVPVFRKIKIFERTSIGTLELGMFPTF